MRYIALAAAVLAVSANATPHKRVMWDCDTHANTVRDLRADGYRLVRHKGDTDVYRLVPQIGRTGAGAEEYQIVHRRGSQDCIAIPQAEQSDLAIGERQGGKGGIPRLFMKDMQVSDYEIWGPNDDGDEVLLSTGAGDIPSVGDTVEVEGKTRKVKQVYIHHSDDGSVTRVRVGQYDDGEPMPFTTS